MAASAPTRWRATVLLQADANKFKEGLFDPHVSKIGTQVLNLVACGRGKAQAPGWGRKVWICWTLLAGGQLGDSRGQLQAVLSPLNKLMDSRCAAWGEAPGRGREVESCLPCRISTQSVCCSWLVTQGHVEWRLEETSYGAQDGDGIPMPQLGRAVFMHDCAELPFRRGVLCSP